MVLFPIREGFNYKKIKISKDKYEEMYQIHLKENGIVHSKFVRTGFDKSNCKKYDIVQNEKEYIYTEKDIDEKLLISKTGKKLSGMAKINKINKILLELNSK